MARCLKMTLQNSNQSMTYWVNTHSVTSSYNEESCEISEQILKQLCRMTIIFVLRSGECFIYTYFYSIPTQI